MLKGTIKRHEDLGYESISLSVQRPGQVYTPSVLADWVAKLILQNLRGKSSFSILDPACGDGELIAAISDNSQVQTKIYGADIDIGAVNIAAKKFPNATFVNIDAIRPNRRAQAIKSWIEICGNKLDAIIANPPWGADVIESRQNLLAAGYTRNQLETTDRLALYGRNREHSLHVRKSSLG